MATTKGHPTPQIKHITIASIVDPSNSPIDNTPLSLTVALTEEDDVHAMLSRMKCFGLKPVGSPTNQTDLVASFAQLEDGQSYDAVRVQSLQYDSFDKTIERLEAYRSNAHNAFAKKVSCLIDVRSLHLCCITACVACFRAWMRHFQHPVYCPMRALSD